MYRLPIYINLYMLVSSSNFVKVTLQAEPFPMAHMFSLQKIKRDKRGSTRRLLQSMTSVSIFLRSYLHSSN